MKPFRTLCRLFFLVSLSTGAHAQDGEGDSSAGLPEALANDYLVAANTMSPNEKFAVIYPKEDSGGEDQIVSLHPFAILGVLETKYPYFKNESHGGLSAEWSEDGSVALVTNAGKWGPRDIFLLEFGDGKLKRSTKLLAKAHSLLAEDYRRARAQPYNDDFDFVFEDEEEPAWKLEGTKTVRINALASTDPKGAADGKVWEGRLAATWDIVQGKFTAQKVTRAFAGLRKHED
ncbi:MAG: hypothetical protein ABI992_08750 [Chthoniobacterales bacterium]